jgi:4-hydroxythreonine-4-phosphate dehydrogenase
VLNVYDEKPEIKLGVQSPAGGEYALKSLNAASFALSKGDVDVLVTAPIDKENIQSDEFNFPGHTEYLEEKFGNGKSLMFLLNDDLRVAVVTGHIPVTKVAEELTTEKISKKLDILNESLKNDFLIRAPKIAVLGLNPHAGDNGVIGDEEKTIIIPAINAAKDKNMLAYGPFPADGFFGSEAYKKYDAVLAMYHDQGLVPFKTLSFNAGVNYTAGLSVVRTSPDHGTAYDIAGRNIANEASFRKAIYTAIDIFRERNLNKELNKNPLKLKSFKSER